jgi:hypothetical protein
MGKWEDPLTQIIAAHIDVYQDLFLKCAPGAKHPLRIWKTSFNLGDKYWPQYYPGRGKKRIDLTLIDESEQHLIVVEAKLPKPIRSHCDCSKNLCPICQINDYEKMLHEDIETENTQMTIHKILLLFLNEEAKRWQRKHQQQMKMSNISLQPFPPVQTLIQSVISCTEGHGHMLFEKVGDAYKEKDGPRIWPIHHPNVFLPCEHGRYTPWPTSEPKQEAFNILLDLKKRERAVTAEEYLSMCRSRGAGRNNLKADGRFSFNKALQKKGLILLEWP